MFTFISSFNQIQIHDIVKNQKTLGEKYYLNRLQSNLKNNTKTSQTWYHWWLEDKFNFNWICNQLTKEMSSFRLTMALKWCLISIRGTWSHPLYMLCYKCTQILHTILTGSTGCTQEPTYHHVPHVTKSVHPVGEQLITSTFLFRRWCILFEDGACCTYTDFFFWPST